MKVPKLSSISLVTGLVWIFISAKYKQYVTHIQDTYGNISILWSFSIHQCVGQLFIYCKDKLTPNAAKSRKNINFELH